MDSDSEVESLVLLQNEISSSTESSEYGKIHDSFYWILSIIRKD